MHTGHRRLQALGAAGCVAAAICATPALAFFDHYLSGTIVGTLTKDQLDAATRILRETLEQGRDGTAVPFTLPPDTRNRRVEGTFTPLRTMENQGDRCRRMRSEFRRLGEQESWSGWYCKTGDGKWEWRKLSK